MNSQEALTEILECLERDEEGLLVCETDSEFSDVVIDDPAIFYSESDTNGEIQSQGEEEVGKDGEIWSSQLPPHRRIGIESIFKKQAGFTKSVLRNAQSPAMTFFNFFDHGMLEKILSSTNRYISLHRPNFKQVTIDDLKKFIGASIFIGLSKGKNMDVRKFWPRNYGQKLIYESIPANRFEEISASLRFDSRESRIRSDKLAPIRNIFNRMIQNCQRHYCPSVQVTIDEQLVSFRGRYGFKMNIPSKPGRYGLKIWALCDSKNAYLYNAKVYLGKENGKAEVNQGENVVKTLCQPIFNSGRNVTTDNLFTSLSLARFLLGQRLTILGTVRKN